MTRAEVWSCVVDEDGLVFVRAPAGMSEGMRLAVETLVVPFGGSAVAVEEYLRAWRRAEEEFGERYVLGATSAQVRRLGTDEVELGDMYGQFEDCHMSVREFERVLRQLVDFLR
ncbi:hypothetical protein ACH4KU_02815 [Streptomyces althioticus]|uniref:hypothetical protein n=1 Tax=Streptomyces althioticus TaxID=83380 RepID=UPI0037932480